MAGSEETGVREAALLTRLDAILRKISDLQLDVDSRLQQARAAAAAALTLAAPPPAVAAAAPATGPWDACYTSSSLPGVSHVQLRLAEELRRLQFSAFNFVRAPPDYYDQALEFRRDCVGAASIHHLCKSIIMTNTRAHPSVAGWEDPNNSKHYVVIVQYTARLNAEKIKTFLHKLNHGRMSKQYFNMRLAQEDVSDELSGYEHNAVSPIAMKTPLPIILSHRIAELRPDYFWLGAGEVDLKVGLHASEFIAKYQPLVVDCT